MTYPTEHEHPTGERGSQPSTSTAPETSGERATHLQHMAAGATAGIVEHVAMFPLDTIKTRMQAQPHGERRRLRCYDRYRHRNHARLAVACGCLTTARPARRH